MCTSETVEQVLGWTRSIKSPCRGASCLGWFEGMLPRTFSKSYKCVFITLWSTKMAWAMWLIVSDLWEFTIRASYNFFTVFLFVNNKNNNFIKEIKHVFHASIACWKPRQSLWEFSSRWKPSISSRVFTDLLSNSPKRSPRFSPGYEGTENMFYFLIVTSHACIHCFFSICTNRPVATESSSPF